MIRVLSVLLTLTLGAQLARAQDALIPRARQIVQEAMATHRTPGASVSVSGADRFAWHEGFGLASIEFGTPATPETKFRIGSVSKALTAVGLALLVQQGAIDLDLPIQQYVPGFPPKRWTVTTRQVAGHIAGIRHYRQGEFLSQRRYATVDEGLTIFIDDSLLFEPGTRYAYSSYGFNLVSAAMEGASGRPFLRYMQERVFRPAGMPNTVPEYPDSIIMGRSSFYMNGPVVVNAPMVDNSYKWAGGGYLSTTADLARFGRFVMDAPSIADSIRTLMFTSQRTSAGEETRYSIGWQLRKGERGELLVTHGGLSIGGSAMLILVPAKKGVVAVLCNDDSRFAQVAFALTDHFFGVR